jgi:hypothetical protein
MGDRPLPLLLGEERELKSGLGPSGSPAYTAVPNDGLSLSTKAERPLNYRFCADCLTKLKDFPAAIGGSGETLPE